MNLCGESQPEMADDSIIDTVIFEYNRVNDVGVVSGKYYIQ
jgi:hypothetical protein